MPFTDPHHLHDAFAAAFAAADVDALVDLYETNAVQLAPDGRKVTGREGLRTVFESLLNAGVRLEGTQQTALVVGDLAVTSTQYEVRTIGPDGEPRTAAARTAEVSRQQADGSWRVVIDVPAFA